RTGRTTSKPAGIGDRGSGIGDPGSGGLMGGLRLARVAAVSFLVLLPAAAWAQSSITGVVRDASSGVLPGVTVEAASPALIEGVRSATTDAQGIYKVVDLRPGTYTV